MTKKIYFTHKQTNKQTNKQQEQAQEAQEQEELDIIEKQPQQQHLGEEIVQRRRHSEVNGVA
jgi:hypothetical protein